jgi:hypothetical protein
MGYRVLGAREDVMKGHAARPGLEGPFAYPNGRVLYYDPREGQYWDPRTDFYVDHDEVSELHQMMMTVMAGAH